MDTDRIGIAEGTTISGLESLVKSHLTLLKSGAGGGEPHHRDQRLRGPGQQHRGIELGINAHAITLCSGCASSNDALGYAMDMIRCDNVDVMITGGTDANLSRELWVELDHVAGHDQAARGPGHGHASL